MRPLLIVLAVLAAFQWWQRGWPTAVEAVASDRLDPTRLFTHAYSLDELGAALPESALAPALRGLLVEYPSTAVLAASIFHFGEHTVAEAKEVMAAAGLTVRR